MRIHRVALSITIPALAIGAALIFTGGGIAAPVPKEASWTSSPIHDTQPLTTLRTPELTEASLQPLAIFAASILAHQAQLATEAAAAAASARSAASTSPASSTTAPPAGCGARPDANYALDATTTATPDWCCIRTWESGLKYTDYSGAYGFEGGDYSAMPPAQQDALALAIFGRNHDHFLGAWNGSTEKCGLT